MKSLFIHILSFGLLIAVGYSSLSNDSFIGEKEKYEIEDSLEEFKEGKALLDLLSEIKRIQNAAWIIRLNDPNTSIIHWDNLRTHIASGSPPKYILNCSLSLCS
ncbi:MAG: hypothetical protein RH860_11640 [Cytophagales bacterium]